MLYRASVIDNRPDDPQWRLLVQCVGLTGQSQVEAWPMLVANTLQERPDNGATVWVAEADGGLLVWLGQWAPVGTDVPQLLEQGHEQFLTNEKHDIEARHTFGAAYGNPATPSAIGIAASSGSGNNPSKEDHIHIIGSGAINSSGMFSAGVVNTAALADAGPGARTVGAAATVPVVTIDAKGRVTALTSATITPGAIGAPSGSGTHSGTSSGTNTGDQNITLTGAVTGSGTSSVATALASGSVTQSKLASDAAVWSGSYVGFTDSLGTMDVPYGRSFGSTPDPIVTMGDSAAAGIVIRHNNNTSSSFNIRVINYTDGSVLASTQIRVNWMVKE